MSVGRSSQMFGAFKDLMCDVRVVPYPATFEGDDAAEEREAGALSALEALLADHKQDIAAMIIERVFFMSSPPLWLCSSKVPPARQE